MYDTNESAELSLKLQIEQVDLVELEIQIKVFREILLKLQNNESVMEEKRTKLSKLSQRKKSVLSQNTIVCRVCNSIINLDTKSNFVTCINCKEKVCKDRPCAIWIPKSDNWSCKLCNSFASGSNAACDWLLCQLNRRFAKNLENEKCEIIWNEKSNTPLIPLEKREKVREFIEDLIASLVGGSVDDVSVSQLYNNYECLPLGEKSENPQDSYTNLKLLVQRIIEEAFKLPEFFDYSGIPERTKKPLPEFDPKKYEELLATAVLNKIVESYNYEKKYESSGIHSGSDAENILNQNIGKRRLEVSSSSSSDEPKSDTSLTHQSMSTTKKATPNLALNDSVNSDPESMSHSPTSVASSDYLSDYIQNHKVPLPNFNNNQQIENDEEPLISMETEGNWEENWLFQKRKQKNEPTTVSTPTSIAMLVPSPTEEVKALIGDKSADEVSDLSEVGSSASESEESESEQNLPHVLVGSKTLIGGKNDVGPFNEIKSVEDLLQPDSLVSQNSSIVPGTVEAKNNLIFMDEVAVTNGKLENSSDTCEVSETSTNEQSLENNLVNNVVEMETTREIISDRKHVQDNLVDIDRTEVEIPDKPINVPVPAPRNNKVVDAVFDDSITESENLIDISNENDNLVSFSPSDSIDDNVEDKDNLIESPEKRDLSDSQEESFYESLEPKVPKIDQQSDELRSQAQEDYICKVQPNEYDLSLDSANLLQDNTITDRSDVVIDEEKKTNLTEILLPDDKMPNDLVSKAVYMSSKPALIAVKVGSNGDINEMCKIDERNSKERVDENLLDIEGTDHRESIEKNPNSLDEVSPNESAVSSTDIITNNQETYSILEPIRNLTKYFEGKPNEIEENQEELERRKGVQEDDLLKNKEVESKTDEILLIDSVEEKVIEEINESAVIESEVEQNVEIEEIHERAIKNEVLINAKVESDLMDKEEKEQKINKEQTMEQKIIEEENDSSKIEAIEVEGPLTKKELEENIENLVVEVSTEKTEEEIKRQEDKEQSITKLTEDIIEVQAVKIETENSKETIEKEEKVDESTAEKKIAEKKIEATTKLNGSEIEEKVENVAKKEKLEETYEERVKQNLMEEAIEENVVLERCTKDITEEIEINQEKIEIIEKPVTNDSEEKQEFSVNLEISDIEKTISKEPLQIIEDHFEEKSVPELSHVEISIPSNETDRPQTTELLIEVQPESQEKIIKNNYEKSTTEKGEIFISPDSSTLLPILLNEHEKSEEMDQVQELLTPTNNLLTNKSEFQQINNSLNLEVDGSKSPEITDPIDLPGSIAEREHLKWKNAQEIPNNPYSPEALQRRLSQPANKTSDIQNINSKLDRRSIDSSSNRPVVLDIQNVDPARYGRDYYINNSKNASGVQRRHSDHPYSSSDDDYIPVCRVQTPDIIETSPTTQPSPASEVFTAKPIFIEDSDRSLPNSNNSENLPSSQYESLTLSEDSDTTRVYDLNRRETKILRHELIKTSKRPEGAVLTPPPSPVGSETSENTNLYVDKFLAIQHLTELRSSRDELLPSPTKQSPLTSPVASKRSPFNSIPVSPDTVKLLAPKKKPNFWYKSKMSVDEATLGAAILEGRIDNQISSNGLPEKSVIEEDVLPALPSVKALAKSFSTNFLQSPQPQIINRPKSLSWQSSREPLDDNQRKRSGSPMESISDAFLPPFYSTYHPVAPGHSITARSLSTKFREELKNQTAAEPTENGKSSGHISPERPSSPVLVPGKLKSNIAFFENLKNDISK